MTKTYLNGFPKKRICKDCGMEFLATNPINTKCGSRKLKSGCSYKSRLKWGREVKYPKDKIKYKEYYKKYDRIYKYNKRKNDFSFLEKSKEQNKKWRNSDNGKLYIKNSYKKYLPLKLESNRHRKLVLKGVKGKHTKKEWEILKKKFNFCCAICGISENILKIKWENTQFGKLTKDHIIPISKNGTENIENIQPLCISCNAKKKDKLHIYGFVGITFGAMSLLHAGHLLMLEECKRNCDYLIVGLHEDPSIERPEKNKPIETVEERMIRLQSCRYVDNIIIYKTEKDLINILKELKPDIRFIGADWKGKHFTGDDLPIKVIFNSRDHNYSSSNLIERIKKS